jgi:hypothetical protein
LLRQQSFSERRRLINGSVAVAALAAGLGCTVSWGVGSGWHIKPTGTLLAFAAFVALGDLLEIPLERRESYSLALAPALAFALQRTKLMPPHLGEVTAVFVAGSLVAMVYRMFRGRATRARLLAARLLVLLAAAAAYRGVVVVAPGTLTFGPARMSALGLAAVLALVVVLDAGLQSLMGAADESLPLALVVRDQLRSTGPLLLSTVSVAALLALAFDALQMWTLPLFLAPLAATQYSFRQVASIRKNYLQTVRALARVPEMAGYTQQGHSGRVAALSVSIAKEMGIGDPDLHEIEYAALLHDIGRVSLEDPEDSIGKTSSSLQLALVGAGIIEETGHFPSVARMVRDQHEPYRRRGEDVNRQLPPGGKIIKVASAYDDLTEPPGPGRMPWDALERLHLGMAYEFDPSVIQALTRVLEKDRLI